jgi:hypothetical protein
MSALLAPDRIALLQWDFRVTVAAEIVNSGAFASGLEGVSTWRGRHDGNLVSFTGHLKPLSPMLKEEKCSCEIWCACCVVVERGMYLQNASR